MLMILNYFFLLILLTNSSFLQGDSLQLLDQIEQEKLQKIQSYMDQSRFLQKNNVIHEKQNDKLDQLLDWATELAEKNNENDKKNNQKNIDKKDIEGTQNYYSSSNIRAKNIQESQDQNDAQKFNQIEQQNDIKQLQQNIKALENQKRELEEIEKQKIEIEKEKIEIEPKKPEKIDEDKNLFEKFQQFLKQTKSTQIQSQDHNKIDEIIAPQELQNQNQDISQSHLNNEPQNQFKFQQVSPSKVKKALAKKTHKEKTCQGNKGIQGPQGDKGPMGQKGKDAELPSQENLNDLVKSILTQQLQILDSHADEKIKENHLFFENFFNTKNQGDQNQQQQNQIKYTQEGHKEQIYLFRNTIVEQEQKQGQNNKKKSSKRRNFSTYKSSDYKIGQDIQ